MAGSAHPPGLIGRYGSGYEVVRGNFSEAVFRARRSTIRDPGTGRCSDAEPNADQLAEAMSNARLYSAAPELLEALKKIAALDQRSGASLRDRAGSEIARAAIALAEGEG